MGIIYNNSTVTNGLVLCLSAANRRSYPGTGTVWYDLSGNGNHGTLTNGPTFNSANGGSISFDGVNDYVPSLNLSLRQDDSHTAMAWVRMPNISDATRRFFVESVGSPVTFAISLSWGNDGVSGRNNNFQAFTEATSNANYNATSTTNPIANRWYHVVSRVDTLRDQISIFVNGVEEATTTFGGDLIKGVVGINIGTYRLANERFMLGQLDDIRIYNRALTPSEIALLASRRGVAYEIRTRRAYSFPLGVASRIRRQQLIGTGVY